MGPLPTAELAYICGVAYGVVPVRWGLLATAPALKPSGPPRGVPASAMAFESRRLLRCAVMVKGLSFKARSTGVGTV